MALRAEAREAPLPSVVLTGAVVVLPLLWWSVVVSALSDRLDQLEAAAGPPGDPPSRDGWELVLSESVAYLVNDERRWAAMAGLRMVVGLDPQQILAATDEVLLGVVAGMQPLVRVSRLRRCAELALAGSPWQDFPSIGRPGVDRIRLFTGEEPVLALDSNGLRVLLRWGYGAASTDYATSYRSAQQASVPELDRDVDVMVRAHLLLRRHGKTLCRRTRPACGDCPVVSNCPSAYRIGAASD